MIKRLLLFSICTVVILLTTSCASLIPSAYGAYNPKVVIEGEVFEPVTIITQAKIYKDVSLPIMVDINPYKINGQHIQIQSPNYVYQDIVLQTKINGWTWANALNCFVGVFVDMGTNCVVKPKESKYKVVYQPKQK